MQDVTNALVGQYQLNDILRIILETMYRAMGFTRVILCVRDAPSNSLKGRFGFGANVDEIIRRGFAIPIGGTRDVFQASIANGADIMIEDVRNGSASCCRRILLRCSRSSSTRRRSGCFTQTRMPPAG
jgi:hypothetical protein